MFLGNILHDLKDWVLHLGPFYFISLINQELQCVCSFYSFEGVHRDDHQF